METEEGISTLTISDKCIKTNPCLHDVEITYTYKPIESKKLTGLQIYTRYKDYITLELFEHFLSDPNFFNQFNEEEITQICDELTNNSAINLTY